MHHALQFAKACWRSIPFDFRSCAQGGCYCPHLAEKPAPRSRKAASLALESSFLTNPLFLLPTGPRWFPQCSASHSKMWPNGSMDGNLSMCSPECSPCYLVRTLKNYPSYLEVAVASAFLLASSPVPHVVIMSLSLNGGGEWICTVLVTS